MTISLANMKAPPRIVLNSTHYTFTPRWLFLAITVILLAVFCSLGRWQLHRAEEKQRLQQRFDERQQMAPVALQQLPANNPHYYPVQMRGHYDNEHTILLDNKIQQHQVGYEVVQPFQLEQPLAGITTVLVNRGWIPADSDRSKLPKLDKITGMQTVQGKVYVPLGKPFTLGKNSEALSWPLRTAAIEIPNLEHALQQRSIFPYVIWLNPNEDHGFVRNWQPINSPAHKHLGYAVQWFAFAALLIILFIGLNVHKRKTL